MSANDCGRGGRYVGDEIKALLNDAQILGITIKEEQIRKFREYEKILEEWNRKINLVSFKDKKELYRSHFLDSLWCVKGGEFNQVSRVIDVGSGAGFPGIPLKICFPYIQMFLLEAQRKRSIFLQETIKELKIKDCFVLNCRAEDLAHDREYRESFKYAVVRAVASLPVILELTLPFLEIGGRVIALKGRDAENEVGSAEYACQLLGGQLLDIVPYKVREEEGRNVVIYKKIKETPSCYPRRSGIPQKRPLGIGKRSL